LDPAAGCGTVGVVVVRVELGGLLAAPAGSAVLHLRPRVRYGAAIVIALVALAIIDVTRAMLPGGGVFLLLLIPVMLGAVVLGSGPGTVVLLLGAVGSVLLVVLRGHPWLSDAADVSRLAMFAVEGGFVLLLAEAVRTTARSRPDRSKARPAPAMRLVEPLTDREREVLRLAAGGLSIEAIGDRLYLSRNTVKSHLAHAYGKLGAHNRAEAIAAGLHWGCIEPSALALPSAAVGTPVGAAGPGLG
jgi:DNA-binding CsgD family transcriptional regulator